jgi:hypothetical protein
VPLDLYAGDLRPQLRSRAVVVRPIARLGPDFVASDTEAVWELADHRSLVIEENVEHAGHSIIFVDDFDTLVAQIAERGIEPVKRETYPNGVRKALFRDPDGNEIAFGGAPV